MRSRIYFTSESHIHSLINVLQYAHLQDSDHKSHLLSEDGQKTLAEATELDYLTQVVFRMYEDLSAKGTPE